MRIGSPSLEAVLLAANVALVVLLGVVHLTQDTRIDDAALGMTLERADGLPVLIVVAQDAPSDRAVAAPAAEALGGALLAVPDDGLPPAVTAQLSESRPERILVLGGPAVVSEATATELLLHTRRPVTRVSGADRFTTAARVATSLFTAPVERLRVMSGDAAPQTLTPELGPTDGPLLLVGRDRLPADVAAALRQLRPRTVEVSGGPDAVSDAVLQQLQDLTPARVVRLTPST